MVQFRLCLAFVMISLVAGVIVCTPFAVATNEKTNYQALELFTDVLSIIHKSYVEETDTTELIYGAIKGMLATLDPHSSFMTPDMYQEMKNDTEGEFGGLGIEITKKDGILVVVSPIEDTPAFKAGIKAGDQIVKINDQPTKDMEVMEAVRLLRGKKGDAVTIYIMREGFSAPEAFEIVRDIIHLYSVKSRLLQPGYGYVRLSQFQARTGEDLKEQLAALQEANGKQLNGLILDLRNNPGGLLDQAVAVADLFLSEGLIVYTEGREVGSQVEFRAQNEGTEPRYPLIVLINGGSASASEIVAGALQDHDRALLLGEQSFGKGSVQSIIPMGDNSGLRLTTARYFTPAGVSIQARGITPDILVAPLVKEEHNGNHLREKDLQNHFSPLENKQAEPTDEVQLDEEDKKDYQLMRALDLLKGVDIFMQHSPAA
ncbi:S41 family peptidase [Malonomonas rubra]|uniref:S41 family peptidase n=1 Tax=Malonomonas rubra TaxID=57040 RepID=UPI0026ED02EC|nr:S41 family peptidase [Malonomonas rubra]